MKLNIKHSLVGLLTLPVLLGSCEGEKDLIIIDGSLPIKTSTLYMVGDATPNGWSIDNPTPLIPSDEDNLVFSWEGPLNKGELKLCLVPGSWDVAFIRPETDQTEINRNGISGASFQMHAGDPDEKWRVTEAGYYNLTFDLRNWNMESTFIREADPIEIIPIAADSLYIVGDASPKGWNIDEPIALEKQGEYTFIYSGALYAGELKACTTAGSWDVPFVRPLSNGVEISPDGIEDNEFIYTESPDNKWVVTESGNYTLTFDLENWTIEVSYEGELVFDTDPIDTNTLYIIGDATPGGWSMGDLTALQQDATNPYIFTWQGTLTTGEFKACTERDDNFSCPFIMPEGGENVDIPKEGLAATPFVYRPDIDCKWVVTEAAEYSLLFDLEHYTLTVAYVGEADLPEEPSDPLEELQNAESLYLIGDATPYGWSLDKALVASKTAQYIYSWTGDLNTGSLKACVIKDFSAPFLRPATDNCEINTGGVADNSCVYTTEPDDKWNVSVAGNYTLTFNVNDMTLTAVYNSAVTEPEPGTEPLETENLYIIGDATPGGWSLDDATALTPSSKYIFSWKGYLNAGEFKGYTDVSSFDNERLQPEQGNLTVTTAGLSGSPFVYNASTDNKWIIETAGTYNIIFNLEDYTVTISYKGNNPIETSTLYIVGDATPGGWSVDDAASFTVSGQNPYLFTWTGTLKTGEFKGCLFNNKGFDQAFLHPTVADCEVNTQGVANENFKFYEGDPDYKWKVTAEGNYTVTFNLFDRTLSVTYNN